MPYKMIPELSDFCKKENINFMSTPFSVEDAKQIDQFVAIHKVASYEINHIRLLEFLATTGKPILLSTGASTYDEIDFAVKLLQKKNVKKKYPEVQIVSKGDVNHLIRSCSTLIVTGLTTVIVQAQILEKPVISIPLIDYKWGNPTVFKSGYTPKMVDRNWNKQG